MVRAAEWLGGRFQEVLREGYRPSVEVLGLTRVLFCSYWLFWGPIKLGWLGDLPASFYAPPNGPAQLLPGFPTQAIGTTLDVIGIVLFLLVGVGWRTPLTSTLLFAWTVVASAMVFSLGKIDHSFISWLLIPLFASVGWGDAYSLDVRLRRTTHASPSRSTSSWPAGAMAFVLAFGFLTAALPKLGRGWLDPSTQAVEAYVREFYVTQGRDRLLADVVHAIDSRVFWESLDIWTVVFELGVAVTVLWPRLFRVMLAQAAVFHVVVVLVMNISFVPMMFAYLPLMVMGGARTTEGRDPAELPPVVGFGMAGLAALALTGSSLRLRLTSWLEIDDMLVAACIGVGLLIAMAKLAVSPLALGSMQRRASMRRLDLHRSGGSTA